MNEKLTALRRDLHREATELLDKDVLKGTRWLLLKNPENLDEQKDEPARLEEALRLNAPLATAANMITSQIPVALVTMDITGRYKKDSVVRAHRFIRHQTQIY